MPAYGFLQAAAALDAHLEFGLQTIHATEGAAIQRGTNLTRVEQVLSRVQQQGVSYEVSLIFGLPRQTLASFEQTVRWCLERQVPVIKAFPLLLLRGSSLERQRDLWGFVDDGGAMPMVVESDSFGRAEWLRMGQIAEALERSEGNHPRCLAELRRMADEVAPNWLRWRPAAA